VVVAALAVSARPVCPWIARVITANVIVPTAPAVSATLTPVVEARGVTKHFPVERGVLRRTVGQVHAVDGVDLAVGPGSTMGLVGESGSGKSTLGRPVVRLLDLPCDLTLHDVVSEPEFRIGDIAVEAGLVCHPGPTVGYRITADGATLTYMPDHEPYLGIAVDSVGPEWIPGVDLARNADLLIHDAQFSNEEYPKYVGWGHSAIEHTLAFARLAGVRHLVPFHHDPSHTDADLDGLYARVREEQQVPFEITPATEGPVLEVKASR